MVPGTRSCYLNSEASWTLPLGGWEGDVREAEARVGSKHRLLGVLCPLALNRCSPPHSQSHELATGREVAAEAGREGLWESSGKPLNPDVIDRSFLLTSPCVLCMGKGPCETQTQVLWRRKWGASQGRVGPAQEGDYGKGRGGPQLTPLSTNPP